MSNSPDNGQTPAQHAPRPSKTLGELLAGLEVDHRDCDPSTQVSSLAVDSRKVEEGSLYLAQTGATHDGHSFVPQAIQNGAKVLLLKRGHLAAPEHPHLWVEDPNKVVGQIAAAFYDHPGQSMPLAGVTGTNGKSTVTTLLASIIDAAGRPYFRLGTVDNWIVNKFQPTHFTTPFPLELQELIATARDQGAQAGVMEVSSHALAQGRVKPLMYQAIALTSFSQDHLDFHTSFEDYLNAKCMLATQHLAPDGIAVAPSFCTESKLFLELAQKASAKTWLCSRTKDRDAAIWGDELHETATGITGTIKSPAGDIKIESPLIGAFNLDNLMVTAGLALALSLPISAIEEGLHHSIGAPGRLERVRVSGVDGPDVFVDYAHTPDAVARALQALAPARSKGKLIVILGCGGDRDPGKRPLMANAAIENADLLIATSDNPRSEDPESILDDMLKEFDSNDSRITRQSDRAQSIAQTIAQANASDTILIAGKGHEDYQILKSGKIHFDDREQANEALMKRTTP